MTVAKILTTVMLATGAGSARALSCVAVDPPGPKTTINSTALQTTVQICTMSGDPVTEIELKSTESYFFDCNSMTMNGMGPDSPLGKKLLKDAIAAYPPLQNAAQFCEEHNPKPETGWKTSTNSQVTHGPVPRRIIDDANEPHVAHSRSGPSG